MFGWVIGTVAVVGLIAFAKRRRHRHFAYGGWAYEGHGGWSEPPPFGFRRRMQHGVRRGLLRGLFLRLDTTPGQEKAIVSALADARERFKTLQGGLADTRRELAALIGSDLLDQAALGALLSQQRDRLDDLSKELVRTLASVHEALDTEQRRELGELLADGSLGHALRPRYSC